MLKLQDEGLFTDNASKESAFAGILLGTHNENDGVNFSRNIRIFHVATNPAVDETIVCGGKTYTFKASGATGDQINIGGTKAATMANILTKINLDRLTTTMTGYVLQNPEFGILAAEVNGVSPTFTPDGVKIVIDTAWVNTLSQADVASLTTFKIDVSAPGAKPIVLIERNPGTYLNFLY